MEEMRRTAEWNTWLWILTFGLVGHYSGDIFQQTCALGLGWDEASRKLFFVAVDSWAENWRVCLLECLCEPVADTAGPSAQSERLHSRANRPGVFFSPLMLTEDQYFEYFGYFLIIVYVELEFTLFLLRIQKTECHHRGWAGLSGYVTRECFLPSVVDSWPDSYQISYLCGCGPRKRAADFAFHSNQPLFGLRQSTNQIFLHIDAYYKLMDLESDINQRQFYDGHFK